LRVFAVKLLWQRDNLRTDLLLCGEGANRVEGGNVN